MPLIRYDAVVSMLMLLDALVIILMFCRYAAVSAFFAFACIVAAAAMLRHALIDCRGAHEFTPR